MNEREFLHQLQAKAREQEKMLAQMPLSGIFVNVCYWLGEHPWRILIPLAFLISLLLRVSLGSSYTDMILRLFREI